MNVGVHFLWLQSRQSLKYQYMHRSLDILNIVRHENKVNSRIHRVVFSNIIESKCLNCKVVMPTKNYFIIYKTIKYPIS